MKTAERNIQAVKINLFIRRFTVYIKQMRFISISGVEPINILNELFFKLLRMLRLKAIFQSLDGKYFLFDFTWNFSYIHAKSAISQQVVYSSFQSNILVRKLTLLHFAHVCVNLYKI